MIEQTLPLLGPAQIDPGLTGGLEIGVDETFATSTRIHLDETSWIDHVVGWLSGGATLMEMLIQTAAGNSGHVGCTRGSSMSHG